VNSSPQPSSVQARPNWHHLFAQVVRYALAPAVVLFSGFFTANFFLSGQYTWPRTSRAFALTLTVLVLSYEFVYKEQRSRTGSGEQARAAVLYSCVIPYVVGVLLMLALWKL
jgi:hypothetical protein